MASNSAQDSSCVLLASDLDGVLTALDDLLQRTDDMMGEVDQLVEAITASSGLPAFSAIPGLASFSRGLVAERAGLQKLRDSTDHPAVSRKIKAIISAANIPHYEARWAAVKRRHQLVSMAQVFRRQDKWTFPVLEKPNTKGLATGRAKDLLRNHRIQNSAECDAAVEGGAEWIKVSAASHKRWIQQMADAGLFINCDDTDDEDGNGTDAGAENEYDDIVILRMVRRLVEASRAHPYKLHSYPCVRVVLTKIEEGRVPEIDWMINKLRRLGGSDVEVIVDCANGDFLNSAIPPIHEVLQNLIFVKQEETQLPHISDTLNVDANVLLGYISDITNSRCKIEPWHKSEIKHYIEMENGGGKAQQFVPHINSLVAGHPLTCIRSVMANFRRIVTTIATDTERARYRLVVPWNELDQNDRDQLPGPDMSLPERLDRLRALSKYDIPSDLQLPILVVEGDWNLATVEGLVSENKLPPYAVPVVRGMGTATIGPLVYGWHSKQTTVTGCFNFVDRFMSLIQLYGKEHRLADPDDEAPAVVKVSLFRSLLAKRRPADIPPPPRRIKQGDHWRGVKIIPPGMEETGAGADEKVASNDHDIMCEALGMLKGLGDQTRDTPPVV